MSHPLIILGAGASNGCLTDAQKKSRKRSLDFPLVNNLFDPQYFSYLKDRIKIENLKDFIDPLFHKEISDVLLGGEGYLKQISGSLMNRESLEKEVSNLWKTAKGNNEQTQKQLVSFSFYLQFLFYFLSEDIEKENIGGNSYNVLASEIANLLFKEGDANVSIINFNYDLLMRKALDGIDAKVSNRIRYKAIHGSCDNCWICSPDQKGDRPRAPWEDLRSHRDRIKNFGFDEFFKAGPEEYKFLDVCTAIRNGRSTIPRPVLTLPFFEKQVCGNNRYQEIAGWFKDVDKVLVIGWSAKDEDLVKLICKDFGDRSISLTVVAKDDIDDIFNRFPNGQFLRTAQHNGFNEFMRSQQCKTFFGTA